MTVIDGATNNTLPVAAGTNPIAVAVNPNTNQIYVANSGSNNVTVIDGNAPWSADFVVFATGQGMGRRSQPGNRGRSHLTVTPQGSFTSPISFSCTGLPALAGCGFSPASVTPNSSTVTTTLTITTAAPTASLAPPFGRRSSPLYAIWLVLPAMLLGTVGMAAPKRRKLLSYCHRVPTGQRLLVAGGLRWREQQRQRRWRRRRHGWHSSWHLHRHGYWRGGRNPAHDDGDIDGAVTPEPISHTP